PSIFWEIRALQEAFVNFEALGLRGGAIRVNGKIEAFSFGKTINGEVCDENVEKANPNIRGLYAAIQTECAQYNKSANTGKPVQKNCFLPPQEEICRL
ncbi:MAG: DUF2156 domain-containing protein, partial [Ruminococcus sp.]|nr:DUF2156 domain-containing protein [Ruminococcus sp.]